MEDRSNMTRQEEAEAMVDGSHPVDDLNDIVGKFIRDFMVNLAIAIPIYATNGEVNLEVLAPAFGLAFYRACRAVYVRRSQS
jgi:hypothetical protein